jgi:choline dehydrogenase-like flavoprotein
MAAGLKFLDRVAKSSQLAGKLGNRVAPPPEVDLQETEQAKAWVHKWCLSEYHPAGSCAMGSAVDSRLRVYGCESLRVVDASVFPNHVSGNIVSSVYSVGEKGSDIIKEDWDYAPLATAKAV